MLGMLNLRSLFSILSYCMKYAYNHNAECIIQFSVFAVVKMLFAHPRNKQKRLILHRE